MHPAGKLIRLKMAVNDMPKEKNFYAGTLGLPVASDFRIDDRNWWVALTLPGDGTSMVLTTAHENMKPGTMSLYFANPDLAAAQKEIGTAGVKVSEIKNDLYGPGSGVKWLNIEDPEGNQVYLVQG
jgi:predicted enzyme related to lactoylglutathione lyase